MGHYHNERPALFRYQQSFAFKTSKLDFYLEVDKKEVVTGLFYHWEGADYFNEELSLYAKLVEGKKLHEVPVPETDSWSYPYFFYRQMILQITGAEQPIAVYKGKDPQELICRCSAVYESDIRELIEAKLKAEIFEFDLVYKAIGAELMATIGCGSCKHDVETLVGQYIQGERSMEPKVPEEETSQLQRQELPRWQSLDSQNLARESFSLLKSISSGLKIELKLLGTRPGSILIKAENPLNDEQTKRVEEAFSDALGVGLEIQIK